MPKARRLPPFPAIRAFEAAARHLSFKNAADEICVTPSAVSHHVKALEEFLGVTLFLREANQVVLTRSGHDYLAELSGLLDQLDASTRRVARKADDLPLTILCTPGFATRWLAPNMASCPDSDRIVIETCEERPSTDFLHNGADIVIAWGHWPQPGTVWEVLMESGASPVCSPEYLARTALDRPDDLLRATVLEFSHSLNPWPEWCAAAGIPVSELHRGPTFPHCEMALVAAEQGQGVVLAWDNMARRGIAAGRLVRPFDISTKPIPTYSVVYREARRRDPRIRAFRDWIFNVSAAEGLAGQPEAMRTAS